jgi:predicted O-methyltransferase YrrM
MLVEGCWSPAGAFAAGLHANRLAGVSSARVRDVLSRLLCAGTVVASSDGGRHDLFPVAITPPEGAALQRWVESEGAVRTIEVGLGYGVATLFICAGLLECAGDAAHVAIDPNQRTRFSDCGLQVLADAGVAEMVEVIRLESQIALPRLLDEGRAFDLAFVDGNHRFDGVFLDLVYLGRLVRRGGIVFVDDYQLPSVSRAASFCVTNLGWSREEVSQEDDQHSWVVLRTARSADTRPFDHFVDF